MRRSGGERPSSGAASLELEKLQKIYGTLAQEGGAAPGDGRAPVVFLEAVMESYEGKMGLHFHSLMANALRIAE